MDGSPDSAETAGLEDGLDRDMLIRQVAAIQRCKHQMLGLARLQQRVAMVDLATLVAATAAAKQSV